MRCPNCGEKFRIIACKNKLAVDHCDICGGTFFRENEINRLTLADAKRLASYKTTDSIAGAEKLCPRDQTVLKTFKDDSTPQHVTLLRCEKCVGLFAYADDLVAFKQAQKAKIDYYKIWQIPLPSLKAVLVYSFAFAIGLTIIYRFSPINQPAERIRAGQDTCPLQFIKTESATIIYCKTPFAFKSEAHFKNMATGEEIIRPINQQPSQITILSVATSDIPRSASICVKVVLMSDKGSIETACVPLVP